MSPEQIRSIVLAALSEVAPELEAGSLDPRAELRDQLDLDSMDFLNFVLGLHKVLGVDIPEADYRKLATLDGCVAYLAAKARPG
ncbi:MAG TPA: acyl carrier protein [Casimicrobiaceae bacterium]